MNRIKQGKDEFVLVGDNVYYKSNKPIGDKTFDYYPCKYCGRLISNCGWASKSHYDAHKRKGDIK